MPGPLDHHALSRPREITTLVVLCAVQFTHILDFMIMMPLGAQLMHAYGITPAQFTHLVACYGIAAALSGFAGGFVLDRFDRKRALVVLYAGFGLATLSCGLAPSHRVLLLARLAAGAFGGLASSMVTAMVADFIPPDRRGRAMSLVTAAFPVASVLGVPAGLMLAGRYGWHAAFFFLAACSAVNLVIAALALPQLRTAVHDHRPWRQMQEILAHAVHRRAFAVGTMLGMAGGILIPFLAPSYIINVGLDEENQLPVAYAAGGLATAFSTPVIGWLSDRVDRFRLHLWMSVAAMVVTLAIMRLGPSSLAFASLMLALFMVCMSGRYAPAMTMITNAVEARYRGGFMSINSALQLAANGVASIVAGFFVSEDAQGHLCGLPMVSYVACGFFALTILFALELRSAAPHVALVKPGTPAPAKATA